MILRDLKKRQQGFVTVVVLCMVILMTVLLLAFNNRCRASLLDADDFGKSLRALSCAQGGINAAIAILKGDTDSSKLSEREHNLDIDGVRCTVTIIDESGKLNVNLLNSKEGAFDQTSVNRLLRLIGVLNRRRTGHPKLSYGLVPAIIDWTDRDDEVTLLPFVQSDNVGAESFHYSRLDVPYKCKNGPFDTTDELLLVRGVTPEVYDRIRDYVTVYGAGQININCAAQEVIETLSDEMDSALARLIVERRKIKPYESTAEIKDVPGMTESVYNRIRGSINVGPAGPRQYYRVTAEAKVDQTACTVSAALRKDTTAKTVDVVWYKEL